MYIITNGQIVTPERVLTGYDMLVRGDRIAGIVPQGRYHRFNGACVVDAQESYVTPGFIDIHSDYIESMAAPRPTSLMDFQMAVRAAERQLVSHGITSMFHSVSLSKTSAFARKPIREAANVQSLMDTVASVRQGQHLINHYFHVRFEIDNLGEIENLKEYIRGGKVHLLSFMDHSPGQGQYRDIEAYRRAVHGHREVTDREFAALIAHQQHKAKASVKEIQELAALAKAHQIAVASHDDDTPEKVDLVASLGATISEFPITMAVAKKAKEKGLYTLAGAPNVVRGGSHNGNLSAAEAIRENLLDILCSDYYPPSLLHAVFTMQQEHRQSIAEMVKLVTLNPAKAVNMDHDYGSLEEGKKADVLIIASLDGRFPIITSVFVDGHQVQNTYYRRGKDVVHGENTQQTTAYR